MAGRLAELGMAVRLAAEECRILQRSVREARRQRIFGSGGAAGPLPQLGRIKARVVVDMLGYSNIALAVLRVLLRSTQAQWAVRGRPFNETELDRELKKGKVGEKARTMRAQEGCSKTLFRIARLIAEARVCEKLSTMSSRGCSATSQQLLEWLKDLWPPDLRGARYEAQIAAMDFSEQKCKTVRRRFRRVWGVKFLKVDTAEPVNPDILRHRVWEMKVPPL